MYTNERIAVMALCRFFAVACSLRLKAKKATVVFSANDFSMMGGGFGAKRMEVRDLRVEVRPYAQHERALWVSFVPKGARTRTEFVQSSRWDALVLEGWHKFEPNKPWETTVDVNGTVTTRSRHLSFDPAYRTEARANTLSYAEANKARVLFDGTKAT